MLLSGVLSRTWQRFYCFFDLLQSAGNSVTKMQLLMDSFPSQTALPGKMLWDTGEGSKGVDFCEFLLLFLFFFLISKVFSLVSWLNEPSIYQKRNTSSIMQHGDCHPLLLSTENIMYNINIHRINKHVKLIYSFTSSSSYHVNVLWLGRPKFSSIDCPGKKGPVFFPNLGYWKVIVHTVLQSTH